MGLLKAAWRSVDRLLGSIVCAILLALMAITFADVVGRYVFNSPLPGTAELTELGMGVLVFAGLPLVTAARGQITIDLFDRFLTAAVQRVLDVGIALLSAAVLAVFAWRIGAEAVHRGGFGDITTYLHLPIAPFAWFMSVMAALASVLCLAQACAARPESGRA